jgi:hypothetical protein
MLATLIEELEAVDWYLQRVDVASDPTCAEVIQHHLDEEIEHAAMSLEWLRRRIPKFDEELRTYLYTTGNLLGVEEGEEGGGEDGEQPEGSSGLGIGSMRQ